MKRGSNGRCYEAVLRSAEDYLMRMTGPHGRYASLRSAVKSPPSLGQWPLASDVALALSGMFAPFPVGLFFAWLSRTSYRVAHVTSHSAHVCRSWQTRFGPVRALTDMAKVPNVRVGGYSPPRRDSRCRLSGLAAAVHTLLLTEGRRREADVISYGRQYVGWFSAGPSDAANLVQEGRADSGGATALHFCRGCGVCRMVFSPVRPACAKCGGRVSVSSLMRREAPKPRVSGKLKKATSADGWTTFYRERDNSSPRSVRSEPVRATIRAPQPKRCASEGPSSSFKALGSYAAALLAPARAPKAVKRPNVVVAPVPAFSVWVRKGAVSGSPSVIRDLPRFAPVRGARVVRAPVVSRCPKREEIPPVRPGGLERVDDVPKPLYSAWVPVGNGGVITERPHVKMPVRKSAGVVRLSPKEGVSTGSMMGEPKKEVVQALDSPASGRKEPVLFFSQEPATPGQRYSARSHGVLYYPVKEEPLPADKDAGPSNDGAPADLGDEEGLFVDPPSSDDGYGGCDATSDTTEDLRLYLSTPAEPPVKGSNAVGTPTQRRVTNVGLIDTEAARRVSPDVQKKAEGVPLFWGDVSSDESVSSKESSSSKKRRRAAARKQGVRTVDNLEPLPWNKLAPGVELTLEERCKRPLALLPEVIEVLEVERKVNPSVFRFGKWTAWAVLWAHHKCGLISSEEKLMRTRISKGLSPRAEQKLTNGYDPGCGNLFPSRRRFLESLEGMYYQPAAENCCRICKDANCPSVFRRTSIPSEDVAPVRQGVETPWRPVDVSVTSPDNQLLQSKLNKGVRGIYLNAIHKKEKNGYCYLNLFREMAFSKAFYLSDKRIRQIASELGPYPLCSAISEVLGDIGFDSNPIIHINGDARAIYDGMGNRVQVVGHFTASNFYFKLNLLDNPDMALGGTRGPSETNAETEHIDIILPQLRATVIDQISKSKISECMYARELEQQCLRIERERAQFMQGLPKLTIPHYLESAERSKLSSAFPELNIDFKPSKFSQHTMAACVRMCFNELYASKFRDIDYVDVGGDLIYHSMKGHVNVHICNPVEDFKDASRCAKRMQTWMSATPGTAVASTSLSAPLRCCYSRAEVCDAMAPVITAVEVYDISVHLMAEIMHKKGAHVAYVTMVLPGELIAMKDGSCYCSALGVEIRMKGDDVLFNYNGGLGYTHKRQVMESWFRYPCFVHNQCMYTVEMISNRLGVSEITVTRAPFYPKVDCTLLVSVPMIEKDMTVLYLPEYNLDTGLFDFTKQDCIKVDRRFFSEGLVYVMNNCVCVSDKHLEWVCTWLRQNKSRVVISGRVIHNNVYLPEKLVSRVAALLLVVGVKSRVMSSRYAKGLVRAYDSSESLFMQLWNRIKETVTSVGRSICEAVIKFLEFLFPVFKGLDSLELDKLYRPIANFDYYEVHVDIPTGNMEDSAGEIEAAAIKEFYYRNQKRFVKKTVREIEGVNTILDSKITDPVKIKVQNGGVKIKSGVSNSTVLDALHRAEEPYRGPRGGGLYGGNKSFSVCEQVLKSLSKVCTNAITNLSSLWPDYLSKFKLGLEGLVLGKPLSTLLDVISRLKGYFKNYNALLGGISRLVKVYKDSTGWDCIFFISKNVVAMASEVILEVVAGKPLFITLLKAGGKYFLAHWQVNRLTFDESSTGVDDSHEIIQLICDLVWEGFCGRGLRVSIPKALIFSIVRSLCAKHISTLMASKSIEAGRVSCNIVLDEFVNVIRRIIRKTCDFLKEELVKFACDIIDKPDIKGRITRLVDAYLSERVSSTRDVVYSSLGNIKSSCGSKIKSFFKTPDVIARYFSSIDEGTSGEVDVNNECADNPESTVQEDADVNFDDALSTLYSMSELELEGSGLEAVEMQAELETVRRFIDEYQSAFDSVALDLLKEEGYGSELELSDKPGLMGGGNVYMFPVLSKHSMLVLERIRNYLRLPLKFMLEVCKKLYYFVCRFQVRQKRKEYIEDPGTDTWVPLQCSVDCKGAVLKMEEGVFGMLASDLPLLILPPGLDAMRIEKWYYAPFTCWDSRDLMADQVHEQRDSSGTASSLCLPWVDEEMEIMTQRVRVDEKTITMISGCVSDIQNDTLLSAFEANEVRNIGAWTKFLDFVKNQGDGFYFMEGSTAKLRGGSVKKTLFGSVILYILEEFAVRAKMPKVFGRLIGFFLAPKSWLVVRLFRAIISKYNDFELDWVRMKIMQREQAEKRLREKTGQRLRFNPDLYCEVTRGEPSNADTVRDIVMVVNERDGFVHPETATIVLTSTPNFALYELKEVLKLSLPVVERCSARDADFKLILPWSDVEVDVGSNTEEVVEETTVSSCADVIVQSVLSGTLLSDKVFDIRAWEKFLKIFRREDVSFYYLDKNRGCLRGGSLRGVLFGSALLYLVEQFVSHKFVHPNVIHAIGFFLNPKSWLTLQFVKGCYSWCSNFKSAYYNARETRRNSKLKRYDHVIHSHDMSDVSLHDISVALNSIKDAVNNPVAKCFPSSIIVEELVTKDAVGDEENNCNKGITLGESSGSYKGKEKLISSGECWGDIACEASSSGKAGGGDNIDSRGDFIDKILKAATAEPPLVSSIPTVDEFKDTVNEIFESGEKAEPIVTKVAKSKGLVFSPYCRSLMGNLVPPLAPEMVEDDTINARNEYLYLKKQDVYNIMYDVTAATTQLESAGEYELSDSAQNSNLIIYDKDKKKFCGKRADSHRIEYGDKLESDLYCACGKNYCTFKEAMRCSSRYIVSHEQMAVFYSDKILMPLTVNAYLYTPITVKAIRVVETPPGGGKTTEIVCLVVSMMRRGIKFLCCTANKNSCTEIRKRAIGRYLNLVPSNKAVVVQACRTLNDSVRTMDSFLMAGEERSVAVLLLDEVFMVHSGQVLNVFTRVRCERIIGYGDSNQIGFISRTDHALNKYSHIGEMIPEVCQEYRTVSYRCPKDVCELLSVIYKRNIFNPYYKASSSVSIKEISCVEDVPMVNGFKYLVQTQAEKLELLKKVKMQGNIEPKYFPQTVHEAQGDTHDHVYLVRTKPNDDEPFVSDAHNVVAISRHTRSLTYFVIRSKTDDIMSFMIRKCVELQEMADAMVDKSPENLVGEEEDISSEREMSFRDKISPVGSAPYTAIVEFINEVVPGSTSVVLGDMSQALNTSEFISDASGVTISAGKVVSASREQRVWRH
ncbi:polyprotein 1a [Persimmon virus B]|uniref:Polyprotein 1a n=1 Tax=Persimmon virus B TaxID=1493829 RepID=A0A0A8JBS1_9CLOS|nr:polyprotein 1a [Persimmon virus B]BAQ08204.1 polyprotein 1a [Persimmon virus B]